jgi:hypothetical protein
VPANLAAREITRATATLQAIDAGGPIDTLRKFVRTGIVAYLCLHAGMASAAGGEAPDWIQWAVLGAIALLVIGVLLRMVIAARFPKGYGAWARSRRDAFADQNAKWDADDEARR